jgi:hypothetical protein
MSVPSAAAARVMLATTSTVRRVGWTIFLKTLLRDAFIHVVNDTRHMTSVATRCKYARHGVCSNFWSYVTK